MATRPEVRGVLDGVAAAPGRASSERFTSIRSTWGDGLRIGIAGLIVLYGFFVLKHLVSGEEHGVALAWVDGLSLVAALVTFALLLALRPGRAGRLALSAALGLAASANAVGHVWIPQELDNTVLVVIVLLVVAGGMTSSPVAAAVVAALLLGWFAATTELQQDPLWLGDLSDLGVALLAGTMLHAGRRVTMSRLLRAQGELARLSEVDDLTGLANRRGFFAELRRAMPEAERAGRSVVVLYCDVDGLKRVNDTLGHEAGDLLLVEVARRLDVEFTDARCVARLGGDEFGVVLVTDPGADAVAAAALRASLVEDVTAEAVWSLSVGAAASHELPVPEPRHHTSHDQDRHGDRDRDLVGAVVGLADERMYEAKRLRPRTRP